MFHDALQPLRAPRRVAALQRSGDVLPLPRWHLSPLRARMATPCGILLLSVNECQGGNHVVHASRSWGHLVPLRHTLSSRLYPHHNQHTSVRRSTLPEDRRRSNRIERLHQHVQTLWREWQRRARLGRHPEMVHILAVHS